MKKKKRLIMSCLFALLCTGMAQADGEVPVYAYVQSGSTVTANGVAQYDVCSNEYTMQFDSKGNAVITYGTGSTAVNVAKLLSSEIEANYELVATLTAPTGVTTGSITKTIGTGGYATFYSPFAVTIPSDVIAYAPTYALAMKSLLLSDETKISSGTLVPARTGLVLNGTTSATITFAAGTETADTHATCLFGSAIGAANPDNTKVYGINTGATGFTKYAEANLAFTDAYYLNDSDNPVSGDDMAFISSEADVPAGSFCAYVQQTVSGSTPSVVTADGANLYDVSDGTTTYTLCFDTDDNAVIMNSANQVIASLPVNSETNGELVVSAENTTGMKLGYIKMTFDSYGYKTLCSPFNLTVPSVDSMKVFAPTAVQNKYISLTTPITAKAVVPASTGLLLDTSKEAKTVSLLFSNSESTASVENNILNGVTLDTNVEGTSLVLGKSSTTSDFGFFKIKGTTSGGTTVYTVTASKAYIENKNSQYAKGLTFIYDDPTGIEEIEESKGSKEIEEKPTDGAYYNLAGQRVGSNAKGIVIHNGKKILINK